MRRSGLREALCAALLADDLETILRLAGEGPAVMSFLTAMTYAADPVLSSRAVLALGEAARVIAAADPGTVREHLRRLFWLLNDESGGVGWRAPESIRAILDACPGLFPEFEALET